MKTPTINQINGRLKNCQTIAEYKKNGTDAERYNYKNYRNKSFNFLYGDRPANVSMNGNFIFGAALKSLNRICQLPDKFDVRYRKLEVEVFGLRIIKSKHFILKAEVTMSGVFLEIETDFKPFRAEGCTRWQPYQRVLIRSNETWEQLDIEKYFLKKVLPKFMYNEGVFRDIQLLFNINKKEAREKYIEISTKAKQNEEVDTFKSLRQQIKKRVNILVDQNGWFRDSQLLPLLKQPRRKKRANGIKTPSFSEVYDFACGESDTEDGMINAAENYYDQFDNAVFI